MLNENPQFKQQDEVLQLLNVAPETLSKLVEDYLVLAVQQNDGTVIYPSFQFTHSGMNLTLSTIFTCFKKANKDGWAILHWLLETNEILGQDSPLEHLLKTNDLQKVRTVASVYCDLEMLV